MTTPQSEKQGVKDEMTDTTQVNTEDYGELRRDGPRAVLRFTRRLPHPPQKVWRALTEAEHLDAWFPTTIEGERAPGAHLRFAHRDHIVDAFEGEMLAFEPPSLMELTWGEDRLRFELRPDPEGSVLTLEHTFDELGKAARDGAGWHACLDLLAYELGGQVAPWSSSERWREVRGAYVERLGPDASTIGPPKEWEQEYGEVG
jgi:uncharacterized protein YndB with AHSA1/START domain